MPVSTTHRHYNDFTYQWLRCRDAYNGGDAVKAKAETYLPKLSGQNKDDYEAYKKRSLWYGATARTVNGLTGAVMRKDPKVDVPDAMVSHLDDITLSGTPSTVFLKSVLTNVLMTGRYGVLVEMASETDPATLPTTRPYWVGYEAEQIINWRTANVGGIQILTMVVLQESHETMKENDKFAVDCTKRYRVLTLEEGKYIVRLYTPNSSSKEGYTIEEIVPTFRQQPLNYIPFCFFGPCSLDPTPEKPPLLDMVDVNLSHYVSSADLEHGRHFTALPTPWIAGFPKDTKLQIGSSIAWVSPDPQAHAGMLEFTGQGLGALERALESKERLMAVLGARMLEAEKAGVEATETLMLRSAGERSTLQSVAMIVSLGVSKVLRWHAAWMGIKSTEGINAELNSDFMAVPLSSADLQALVQAYQAGTLSWETFYWNLQRGEIARPDVNAEDERTLIETQQANDALELPTNQGGVFEDEQEDYAGQNAGGQTGE